MAFEGMDPSTEYTEQILSPTPLYMTPYHQRKKPKPKELLFTEAKAEERTGPPIQRYYGLGSGKPPIVPEIHRTQTTLHPAVVHPALTGLTSQQKALYRAKIESASGIPVGERRLGAMIQAKRLGYKVISDPKKGRFRIKKGSKYYVAGYTTKTGGVVKGYWRKSTSKRARPKRRRRRYSRPTYTRRRRKPARRRGGTVRVRGYRWDGIRVRPYTRRLPRRYGGVRKRRRPRKRVYGKKYKATSSGRLGRGRGAVYVKPYTNPATGVRVRGYYRRRPR